MEQKPYGCHNAERKPSYLVPVRVTVGETLAYATQTIVDRSSIDCRYDNKATDPQCQGCKK